MPRILSEFPKRHPARLQVARRLRQARNAERHNQYMTQRGYELYQGEAGGLDHFFQAVNNTSSQTLLEIGTGSGKAAEHLRTKVTHVVTTGLIAYPERSQPDILTSTEMLRGVTDKSIGGILGIYSLPYSPHPKLTARKIDRVLESGGIIKAVFPDKQAVRRLSRSTIRSKQQSYHAFAKELEKLGYDVATTTNPYANDLPTILVAIKPGKNTVSAQKLLMDDYGEFRDIMEDILNS